eukprot:31182-Pelagococcus_subviridis.AAC.10
MPTSESMSLALGPRMDNSTHCSARSIAASGPAAARRVVATDVGAMMRTPPSWTWHMARLPSPRSKDTAAPWPGASVFSASTSFAAAPDAMSASIALGPPSLRSFHAPVRSTTPHRSRIARASSAASP